MLSPAEAGLRKTSYILNAGLKASTTQSFGLGQTLA